MKKTTKILSIILALVMVLSAVPIASSAYGIVNPEIVNYTGSLDGLDIIGEPIDYGSNTTFKVTEPMYLDVCFSCLDSEQANSLFSKSALDYEINAGPTEWININTPNEELGGEFERVLVYVSREVLDSSGEDGFTFDVLLRSAKYPAVPVQQLGQVTHFSITGYKADVPASPIPVDMQNTNWLAKVTVNGINPTDLSIEIGEDSATFSYGEYSCTLPVDYYVGGEMHFKDSSTGENFYIFSEDGNLTKVEGYTGLNLENHIVSSTVDIYTHEHAFSTDWTTDALAHWHECTAGDCDIEDYAACGITEAAYGEHIDADSNFYCDVCKYFFEEEAVAFYVAKYKADIKDNRLPAAVCDEAREILNKAYEDLDTAATYSDVQSIYDRATGQANGKNSEFTSKLASYKSTIESYLGNSPSAARDNFVENTNNALENSQSIAELDKTFSNGTSKISFYSTMDGTINSFNTRINSGNLSDKSIALAQEAIEKVAAAKTIAEISTLSNQYHSKIDIQIAKEKASAELNAIAEEKNRAQVDAIVDEALTAIENAASVMDINDIKADAIAKIEALPPCEIISVTEVTEPTVGSYVTLEFLVAKPVAKLQFVAKNGNTFTYSATSDRTISIVNNDDGTQTWQVEIMVYRQSDTYSLHVKDAKTGWSDNYYEYTLADTNDYDATVTSCELPPEITEGAAVKAGMHNIVIRTSKDIAKVQFAYNGETATYSRTSARAKVVEEDDCLVWTISQNFYVIGEGITYTLRTRTATTSFEDSGISFTVSVTR